MAIPFDGWRELIGHLPFGLLLLDGEGRALSWNAAAGAHLDIDFDRPEEAAAALRAAIPVLGKALDDRQGAPFELRKLRHRRRYLNISGRPFDGYRLLTTNDVSEEVARERKAVQDMLDWQETERRRLSEEIHDGVGPLLSTLKLSLEGMATPAAVADPDFRNNYYNALELLQNATRELRDLSHALMPAALVDFGLVAALENLCRKARESGQVQVDFYHAGLNERLSPAVEKALYRIAQELLNNAFRHARAAHISVQLIRHAGSIVLMVEDDGIGFDREQLQQLSHRGIGLQNIRMRTRSMGGAFHLESRPGQGVLATVEVPLPGDRDD